MEKELGLDPKWRWDEIIEKSNNIFDLEISTSYTNMFYDLIIVPNYTKNRYYHTLRHVEYMLSHVHEFSYTLKESQKLKWAIWFHDLIYDAERIDNEKKSADALEVFADTVGFSPEDAEEMKWLVLVTSHKGTPQTKLEKIICDLDLREFVSSRQKLNSIEVRQEYSHVSDELFNEGRAIFLRDMLSKPNIYHTDKYRGALEAQARTNLLQELDTLTQK